MNANAKPVPYDQIWKSAEMQNVHIGPSFRHRVRLLKRLMKKHQIVGKFLDVGCGTGNWTSHLTQMSSEVTGVDISETALNAAKKTCPKADYKFLDIENETLSEKFDAIFCLSALEEMKQDDKALLNMRKMLNPGGYVVLTIPHSSSLWSVKDDFGVNCRRYETSELKNKMIGAGLTPVEMLTWGWPLYALWYGTMTKVNQESAWKGNAKKLSMLASSIAYSILHFDDLFLNSPKGRLLFAVAKYNPTVK